MVSRIAGRASGGRPPTGSIKWARNKKTGVLHWHAFITLDGKRPLVPLDPAIPHEDVARAKDCARETSEWFRANPTAADSTQETVSEYATRWLADRVGRVGSIRHDRSRLTYHVLDLIGTLDVRTIGREDLERVRDDLDRKIALPDAHANHLSWKTAANVWTVVTSLFDDAMNSKKRALRVRDDNPAKDVRAPDRGANKAKQYLYPSEFLEFVSCETVPLRWRRAVAVAIYTYTRDGELRVLRWDGGDVDMEHGVLSITKAWDRRAKRVKATKTGETRRFAIEPNLLPLLSAMHDEKDGEGTVVGLSSERAMARNLRRWLWKAGVRRPELHQGSPTRKPLTWHDLRATGATWMAVRGDDPLKIKQRCGHASFSTTEIYIREAEAVREGFGEPFPALPEVLIQFRANTKPNSRKPSRSGGVDGTRTRRTEVHGASRKEGGSCVPGAEAGNETPRTSTGSAGVSRDLAVQNSEPTEAELERGILEAVRLGLAEVARTLSRRLERRRNGEGNVVTLPVARSR